MARKAVIAANLARSKRPEVWPVVIEKTRINGECWEWTGSRGTGRWNQYGWVTKTGSAANGRHRKQKRAHRLSYEQNVGPIPEGMFVCHRCDNPLCVRPDHLFLGTHTDNMRDMYAKGRRTFPERTHCKNGHELVGKNVWMRRTRAGNLTAVCLPCEYERQRKRRQAKRQVRNVG